MPWVGAIFRVRLTWIVSVLMVFHLLCSFHVSTSSPVVLKFDLDIWSDVQSFRYFLSSLNDFLPNTENNHKLWERIRWLCHGEPNFVAIARSQREALCSRASSCLSSSFSLSDPFVQKNGSLCLIKPKVYLQTTDAYRIYHMLTISWEMLHTLAVTSDKDVEENLHLLLWEWPIIWKHFSPSPLLREDIATTDLATYFTDTSPRKWDTESLFDFFRLIRHLPFEHLRTAIMIEGRYLKTPIPNTIFTSDSMSSTRSKTPYTQVECVKTIRRCHFLTHAMRREWGISDKAVDEIPSAHFSSTPLFHRLRRELEICLTALPECNSLFETESLPPPISVTGKRVSEMVQVIHYALHELSFPLIGTEGNRFHSTISSGCELFCARWNTAVRMRPWGTSLPTLLEFMAIVKDWGEPSVESLLTLVGNGTCGCYWFGRVAQQRAQVGLAYHMLSHLPNVSNLEKSKENLKFLKDYHPANVFSFFRQQQAYAVLRLAAFFPLEDHEKSNEGGGGDLYAGMSLYTLHHYGMLKGHTSTSSRKLLAYVGSLLLNDYNLWMTGEAAWSASPVNVITSQIASPRHQQPWESYHRYMDQTNGWTKVDAYMPETSLEEWEIRTAEDEEEISKEGFILLQLRYLMRLVAKGNLATPICSLYTMLRELHFTCDVPVLESYGCLSAILSLCPDLPPSAHSPSPSPSPPLSESSLPFRQCTMEVSHRASLLRVLSLLTHVLSQPILPPEFFFAFASHSQQSLGERDEGFFLSIPSQQNRLVALYGLLALEVEYHHPSPHDTSFTSVNIKNSEPFEEIRKSSISHLMTMSLYVSTSNNPPYREESSMDGDKTARNGTETTAPPPQLSKLHAPPMVYFHLPKVLLRHGGEPGFTQTITWLTNIFPFFIEDKEIRYPNNYSSSKEVSDFMENESHQSDLKNITPTHAPSSQQFCKASSAMAGRLLLEGVRFALLDEIEKLTFMDQYVEKPSRGNGLFLLAMALKRQWIHWDDYRYCPIFQIFFRKIINEQVAWLNPHRPEYTTLQQYLDTLHRLNMHFFEHPASILEMTTKFLSQENPKTLWDEIDNTAYEKLTMRAVDSLTCHPEMMMYVTMYDFYKFETKRRGWVERVWRKIYSWWQTPEWVIFQKQFQRQLPGMSSSLPALREIYYSFVLELFYSPETRNEVLRFSLLSSFMMLPYPSGVSHIIQSVLHGDNPFPEKRMTSKKNHISSPLTKGLIQNELQPLRSFIQIVIASLFPWANRYFLDMQMGDSMLGPNRYGFMKFEVPFPYALLGETLELMASVILSFEPEWFSEVPTTLKNSISSNLFDSLLEQKWTSLCTCSGLLPSELPFPLSSSLTYPSVVLNSDFQISSGRYPVGDPRCALFLGTWLEQLSWEMHNNYPSKEYTHFFISVSRKDCWEASGQLYERAYQIAKALKQLYLSNYIGVYFSINNYLIDYDDNITEDKPEETDTYYFTQTYDTDKNEDDKVSQKVSKETSRAKKEFIPYSAAWGIHPLDIFEKKGFNIVLYTQRIVEPWNRPHSSIFGLPPLGEGEETNRHLHVLSGTAHMATLYHWRWMILSWYHWIWFWSDTKNATD